MLIFSSALGVDEPYFFDGRSLIRIFVSVSNIRFAKVRLGLGKTSNTATLYMFNNCFLAFPYEWAGRALFWLFFNFIPSLS